MINSQINITDTTIAAAIGDTALATCSTCNITLPTLTGECEWC